MLKIPTVPETLEWRNQPLAWTIGPAQALSITAGAKTDLFVDPAGGSSTDTAPSALFTPPDASFILSARVAVAFASTFDAGVLQIHARDDLWAKLCFEYSPERQPMIVSVVTRGTSDDCNSTVVEGRDAYLRLTLTPQTIAFHYSLDGRYWRLVRYFSLGILDHPRVGFSSQSPTGRQCTAIFSEITYRPGELGDIRSGE